MSYRCIYQPLAVKEYKDTVEWYAERSEIAAEGFVKELKDKVAAICKEPLRYRNTYKEFREIALKKYPFSIVYFVDEGNELVIIASVYHQKKPGKQISKVKVGRLSSPSPNKVQSDAVCDAIKSNSSNQPIQ